MKVKVDVIHQLILPKYIREAVYPFHIVHCRLEDIGNILQ